MIARATKNVYLRSTLAFTFKKNSPYRKLFSYFLLAMRQFGEIDRLYNSHVREVIRQKPEHKQCKKTKTSPAPFCFAYETDCVAQIGFETIWTAFLILIIGLLLGLIIIVFECLDSLGHFNQMKDVIGKTSFKTWKYFGRHNTVIFMYIFIFLLSIILLVSLYVYYQHYMSITHGDMNLLSQDQCYFNAP